MAIYIIDYAYASHVGEKFQLPLIPNFEPQTGYYTAPLAPELENICHSIAQENNYQQVDKTVLLAIHLARSCQCLRTKFDLNLNDLALGINIGSSRGATRSWESIYGQYLHAPTQRLSPIASPVTTLGNVSSWVGYELSAQQTGSFSHSVTCSTAAYAIGNAMAWLEAEMCDIFLAGGVEASLTDFTLAQLRSLQVCARITEPGPFPCKPFAQHNKRNTMVLGEGGALFVLVKSDFPPQGALAQVEAFGFGNEKFPHPAAIRADGVCLQKAMRLALNRMQSSEAVDLILAHGNATIQGDAAELLAIQSVFSHEVPAINSTKWFTGHTLGAAAGISLAFGLYLLNGGTLPDLPYPHQLKKTIPEQPIRKIMLNAAGFGSNAASIIISKYF